MAERPQHKILYTGDRETDPIVGNEFLSIWELGRIKIYGFYNDDVILFKRHDL
jgi:hypothetical protein